ncbi:hypothetical protein L484_006245 [Morus notabilis]|uniref:Uncharacterized protein n=1 Tax=Morus notabilis TaxID=981085 RepID=W9QRF1_9ROSA|nr:hypothetical protein L484_006245 [Morus notabilis]
MNGCFLLSPLSDFILCNGLDESTSVGRMKPNSLLRRPIGAVKSNVGAEPPHHVEATTETIKLHEEVVDPCQKPGGPHPGCGAGPNKTREAANDYNRGCSSTQRCLKD